MADFLVTGAAGGVGGVSRSLVELLIGAGASVRAMVRREDERAEALRTLGAQVVVGDLTEPRDVYAAVQGVGAMFFNMSVSEAYLRATAVVCAAAQESGGPGLLVNMSQMTVSQMTLTSTTESQQHRLHWLAERVIDWSGLPVTHLRPTVFIDNPLFVHLNAASVRDRHELVLPFGDGRTSPIAPVDVARVAAAILLDPSRGRPRICELTGPEVLDHQGLARAMSQALGHPVAAVDLDYDLWVAQVLRPAGLPSHVEQHIATMARLHRMGRYDRLTDVVADVTGRSAMTVEQYVSRHRVRFGG
ncbi:NAD(P)H-binding protein [Mycobacterium sp. NPDC050551]|uniref:NAD(P)H-binding protein n=1 Tax=Mycobacterium sp. NPDC050551 TaxID=3155407 RepID=UPI003434DF58